MWRHAAFKICRRWSSGGGATLTHRPRVRKSEYSGIPWSRHCSIISMNCSARLEMQLGLNADIIVLRINELKEGGE